MNTRPLLRFLPSWTWLIPGTALAHPGDHAALRLADVAGHFLETDHLLFAALALIGSLLVLRALRLARLKSQPARKNAGKRP